MNNTVTFFQNAKKEGRKITMLTAYDYAAARLLDEAGVDALLVGDSLGNVVLGYDTTLRVTLDDMIHHGKAVARGARRAFVAVDMPFMSYQSSVYDAVCNAGRIIKETGAQAVKLEGGVLAVPQIQAIVNATIPVMAHVGLTPQAVHALGGFKVQGREAAAAQRLLDDARAVQEAGAFAVVLECVPARLAAKITEKLHIPTIGIGAGSSCDGQVLVVNDMLGFFPESSAKFVKNFADAGEIIRGAVAAYCSQVREGSFPGREHTYAIGDEALEKLY